MKYYRPKLYALCKSNGIKGCSGMKKKELIELLRSKGLIEPPQPKLEAPPIDKQRLRSLWKSPRTVTLRDLVTGKIHEFPSTYKAAKFIGKNSGIISIYNGRDWKGMYHIMISEPMVKAEEPTEEQTTPEPLAGLPAVKIDIIK